MEDAEVHLEESYYRSGGIKDQYYWAEPRGNLHRIDGPAHISYYEHSSKVRLEDYYLNNKRHRIDGPALIYYRESGLIEAVNYYLNGKAHRIDGPAALNYNSEGQIERYIYYINDTYLKRFAEYGKHNLFEYIKKYPEYIQEISFLAKSNNWLTEEQVLLLGMVSLASE